MLTKQCGVVPGLVDRWHHLILLSLEILGDSLEILAWFLGCIGYNAPTTIYTKYVWCLSQTIDGSTVSMCCSWKSQISLTCSKSKKSRLKRGWTQTLSKIPSPFHIKLTWLVIGLRSGQSCTFWPSEHKVFKVVRLYWMYLTRWCLWSLSKYRDRKGEMKRHL